MCDVATVQNLHTVGPLVTKPHCEKAPFIPDAVNSTGFSGDDRATFLENTVF
jgi:hypothetical protein